MVKNFSMTNLETNRPRCLLITDVNPYFAKSGTGQRTIHLKNAFAEHSKVELLVLDPRVPLKLQERVAFSGPHHFSEKFPRWMPRSAYRVWRAFRKYDKDTNQRQAVESLISERDIDFVVIRYCYQAMRLLPLEFGVPVVLDIDDRPSHKALEWSRDPYSPFPIRKIMSWWARRLEQKEAQVFSQVSTSLVANFAEVEDSFMYFPNIPTFFSPPETRWGKRNYFFIVGNFKYTPNRYGVKWFLDEVWPVVREVHPDCQIVIAGAESEVFDTHPGVTGKGFVDNLSEAYAGSCAAIIPIHFGGGSNIKLIEALSHGVPIIATSRCEKAFGPEVAELEITHFANQPHEFARACVDLWGERATEPKARLLSMKIIHELFGPDRLKSIAKKIVGHGYRAREDRQPSQIATS